VYAADDGAGYWVTKPHSTLSTTVPAQVFDPAGWPQCDGNNIFASSTMDTTEDQTPSITK
jgi:hypothetical protein